MNSYLLVWSPKKWEWSTLASDVEQLNQAGRFEARWGCGVNKSIRPGDRFYLMRVGTQPKGILGSGFITSNPIPSASATGSTLLRQVNISFETLLNPATQPILTYDLLNEGRMSHQNWLPQISGISVRPGVVEELEQLWYNFLDEHQVPVFDVEPGENAADPARPKLLTRKK